MKIVGVIPARYNSSRLPGKPIIDINGKPMIWWVYKQLKNAEIFDEILCAIDDNRVKEVCDKYEMKYVMTNRNHPNHIARIQEVSEYIRADFYVCVNGDEPMISHECILPVIPNELKEEPFFCGAMRVLKDPAETIDSANIKLVVSDTGKCIYMSRMPVPYPKGTLSVTYNKYVGIECFNKKALDFFVSKQIGSIERVEDIDHLRFLENGIELYFSYVQSESLSVDTMKDLEKVRVLMKGMNI